jgi:hypothetical protein
MPELSGATDIGTGDRMLVDELAAALEGVRDVDESGWNAAWKRAHAVLARYRRERSKP